MPKVAMATIEPEKLLRPLFLPIIRRAMKSSVFKDNGMWILDPNVVIFVKNPAIE
jgi:hypothetical protein